MKVGIDTFGLDHGKSGLGAYLINLVNHLPENSEFEFELFGHEEDRYVYTSKKAFKFIGIDVQETVHKIKKWHVKKANGFFKKNGYDAVLFIAGSRFIPTKCNVKSIAFVNDVLSAVQSKNHMTFWRRNQAKKGLSASDCIIVPSIFVKKALKQSKVNNPNIQIVHYGIDHSQFFTVDASYLTEVDSIKPFAIKKPYIIYASRRQNEQKKHVELIKAFEIFKQKTHLPHRLVIAGSEGPYTDIVSKAAFESHYGREILIVGYFPHDDFPELYRNSQMTVFPPINEGVGLPVVEAMAAGVPVACSKSGALTEMAGPNALYFDSDNIEEIADCMIKIATDEDLRNKMIQSGLEWSERFSWSKTADEILRILKE